MRIAVLTSSYPRFEGDGTAPFVKSICEHLAKLGHEVEIVAPYDPAVRPTPTSGLRVHRFRYIWPERYHIMGHARSLEADVRLRPLAFLLLPLFLLSAFLTLMRVTGRQKTEALYVHWVLPNGPVGALVAALRRIPFLLSLHGSDVFVARQRGPFRAAAGWVFRRAAAVTACSPELRAGALSLGAGESVRLVPWGADPQVFNPRRRSPSVREAFGWGEDDIILVALGRLVYKKGLDALISALPAARQRCPQLRLVIGGEGPIRAELARQAEDLGVASAVTFMGRIPWDEVPDFLAAADIFALPSILDPAGNMDGLPTALLEAMASGLGVVASRIGGVSLVIEHEHTGLLVPPGDPAALGEALACLAGDAGLRQALGASARKAVEERFNWTQVAKTIEGLSARSIWRASRTPRLGSIYREEMLAELGRGSPSGRVLDVGCHDGYFLSGLDCAARTGVDPEPIPGAPGIDFVRADGRRLPFTPGAFGSVYALDVVEHVEDDAAFARALAGALAPGGRLFLSTPSLQIRMNPPFLTGWISRSWGHHLRLGYTLEGLAGLFPAGLALRVSTWNAPAYRFWYLPLRLLSVLVPGFAARLVRAAARWDAHHHQGKHGFILLEAVKE